MAIIYKREIQRLFPILEAIKEGKTIQYKDTGVWRDIDGDDEGFCLGTLVKETDSYRIKPKYRPFKDAEECWNEMLKHQPFGFTKFKNAKSGYYMITCIASGAVVGMNNTPFDYESMFDTYTFADGTPFGVKWRNSYGDRI